MNAIKFIQDNGVEKAREELTKLPNSNVTHMTSDARMFIDENNPLLDEFHRGQIKDLICIEELKRLVESVDLVNRLGLERAKGICSVGDSHYMGCKLPPCDDLKQAIADYESIGGEHV